MRVLHEWTDKTARIRVEGQKESLRILHVTDLHLGLHDERDAKYVNEHVAGCRDRFGQRRQDMAGRPIYTEVTLVQTLERAKAEPLDLLAHTGDLIHFPSRANVDFCLRAFQESGTPWLYTPGNHDWRYPGIEGGDEVREQWLPVLAPLQQKGNKSHAATEIKGVQFLAFDNSNYQITEEQLAIARKLFARALPTVLLIHIPLSLPTLRPKTLEVWKDPILMGDPSWTEERRKQWLTRPDDPSTLEFMRLLRGSEGLVAILCGHLHFSHSDNVSLQAVQYVTDANFSGGHRLVEIGPL